MNEQFTYRAKRVDNDQWIEGYRMSKVYMNIAYGEDVEEQGLDDPTQIDPETVCRYVAADINNKKIWEGDIFWDDAGEGPETYLIEWDDTELQWWARSIASSDGDLPLCEFRIPDDINVIGNIFDNPEIVKKITEQIMEGE